MMTRFPHLAQQIFNKMDNNGLAKSRAVARTWLDFIDEENNLVYPWLRIVDIPTTLSEGNTYLHLAAKHGQTVMFETILEEENGKNPKNNDDDSPLHLACQKGNLNIIKIFVENSEKWDIALT